MQKISFTTMATPDWDGPKAIKKAKEYGYQGVDLRISDNKGQLKDSSTDAEIKEMRKVFDGEGIIPSSLLSYNAQINKEPNSWDAFKVSVLKQLEIGSKLGTKLVRIFIGNPDILNNREEFIKRTADALAEVLKKDKSDVTLVIQNHGGGANAHDVLNIMKQVKNKRLNLVLCPANALIMEDNLDDIMPVLKIDMPQLYVADIIKSPELKNGHKSALPGKGIIDYKNIYEQLGGKTFEGWISFKWEKIWEPTLEGPEIALPYFIKFIKGVIGEK